MEKDNRATKQTKYLVRLSDSNSKDVTPSLTHQHLSTNVIRKNHMSSLFGRLEEEKKSTNNARTSPRNLFGSRLEDTQSSSRAKNDISAEQLAEFQKDPAFIKIQKVVDALKQKGMLDSDGDLTPNAVADDNCFRDDPVLYAMIEAASCINKNWLSSNRTFLSQLINRCKLVSMVYEPLMQQRTISDTLALSDIMNSKIAYNIWRTQPSNSTSPPPPPPPQPPSCSNQPGLKQSSTVDPLLTSSNFTNKTQPPTQKEKSEIDSNKHGDKESKNFQQQQNISDGSISSNFSMFDVSLESVMDRQVLDMIINDPATKHVVNNLANNNRETTHYEELMAPVNPIFTDGLIETMPLVKTPQLVQDASSISFFDGSPFPFTNMTAFNDSSLNFQTRVDSIGRVFPLTPQLNSDSDFEGERFEFQKPEVKKIRLSRNKSVEFEDVKCVMDELLGKVEFKMREDVLEEGECF